MSFPLLLIALLSAISYAASNIAARIGMMHSTPITMLYFSFGIQTFILWSVVFFAGGVPEVPLSALTLFVIVGLFMPLIRLLTYIGIAKIGPARSATLRSSYPLFSAATAVAVLHEEPNRAVVVGTLLVVAGVSLISWQPQDRLSPSRRWHALYPLAAAILAGMVHPIIRHALRLSNHPLFFAALVGLVSLLSFSSYQGLARAIPRPVWNSRAFAPFIAAGLFETSGFFLFTAALSFGSVVVVSPIIATTPMWVLLGTLIIFRDLEHITYHTILGTCSVVAGTVCISLGG